MGGAVTTNQGGYKLSQKVGNLGFKVNAGSVQHWMSFGYPAASPYNGQWMYCTASSTSKTDTRCSPNPVGKGSSKTPGCSGGPWVLNFQAAAGATNYVNGHFSYYYTSQPLQSFSPYFGDAAWSLYTTIIAR